MEGLERCLRKREGGEREEREGEDYRGAGEVCERKREIGFGV